MTYIIIIHLFLPLKSISNLEMTKKTKTQDTSKQVEATETAYTEKHNENELSKVYISLVFLRFLWTIIGQRSYIHPDEHFQSVEVIASDIFDNSQHAYKTWEFQLTNSTQPIRNIVIPYVLYGIPLAMLKLFVNLNLIQLTTYTLLLLPRLSMTLLSLIGDYFLYLISTKMKLNSNYCLILYSSSYITLVYLTHTFSNSIETALFAILMYKIINSTQNGINSLDLSIISAVISIGVFNRPTFLIYSFVPIIYLLYKSFKNSHLIKSLFILANISLIMSLSLTILDTIYYRQIPLIDYITNFNYKTLIFTPLNFFFYNVNPNNLLQHGNHAIYQHVIVNCLLLFGLQYIKLLRNLKFNFLSIQFIFIIFVFSLIPHKEARFLLPLLILICLMTTPYNQSNQQSNMDIYLYIWLIFNFLLSFIYGIYHQGGLIDSIDYIDNILNHKSNNQIFKNIIFYQTYMPPRYLINLPSKLSTLNGINYQIYDFMSSLSFSQVETQLKSLQKSHTNTNHAYFMITPIINDKHLCKNNIKYELYQRFFFHIQFEDLNDYLDLFLCKYETCNYKCNNLNYLERFLLIFTLNLYQVLV